MKNRLVALPVFTGYAHSSGRVSQLMLDHYAGLAASGVAMVVVANAAVAEEGRTSRFCLRIDSDDYIDGLSTLAHKLMQRNDTVLCVITGPGETTAIKAALQAIRPASNGLGVQFLWIAENFEAGALKAEKQAILDWIEVHHVGQHAAVFYRLGQ